MKADTISMQESKITACLHNRARLIACEAHVSSFERNMTTIEKYNRVHCPWVYF